ncbi:MAG: amidophosphoribosyltransferase [Bacteroidota bacterium]|nr:amidophosphoribosyltransferase [Bacteroidota bacterium]MEC7954938.1 amidophosphoribosyltransferase [Bacteroidota bacterium]MEC7998815.1 amidophosphoribosyltransferase [Bacteroidota bacterium]MEC8005203.1 amidophosphoribosyltransferase [Bacteroidota bacterium]MEC8286898.1 amidophosphoribosyltransferase [Bacteroidota bacterium]|tara:strand:+ start:732 stop:2639 length:1908 start_codon:yes stop_codon:yes gene_type:complete
MSDAIKHECGIALLRLKKPMSYYLDKYGTSLYGLNKMYLLMEKQHNRGQDGAGLANIKFDVSPGTRYISRFRSVKSQPIKNIFQHVNQRFENLYASDPAKLKDVDYLKANEAFTGELYLGHLRYGTFGKNSKENCHPFLRQNNWMTRNLVVAGNFNLTNVDELFDLLVNIGQHPKEVSDTITVIEKIGHFLDQENNRLFKEYNEKGYNNKEISSLIAKNMDIPSILKNASMDWDGGYTMAGLIGHGDAFVLRDPNGIRPAFWYEDDEVLVVTSERPVIQTAFNVKWENVNELKPGHALIVKKDFELKEVEINSPSNLQKCSFERIYFSRGTDKDIYKERLMLGSLVTPQVLEAVNFDLKRTVFSFIPNTAEMSYYGMIKATEDYLSGVKKKKIQELEQNDPKYQEKLDDILSIRTRGEKIMVKDAKLRTFITQDDSRDEMVAHVYDITYGSIKRNEDSLVVIDDSIVRGTTLRKSVIRILDRLEPKKIVVVSSAPQIRYPDCYGIDMAKLGDFIAFQAAVELLKDQDKLSIIDEVYQLCKTAEIEGKLKEENFVKRIYESFSYEDVSKKIASLLTNENINAEVEIIFQTVSNLHIACPNHTGDWYFTGNYPTPGGNKVVNKSFINYVEGVNKRAY